MSVSYTHLRAHETRHDLVCRLLLEKKKRWRFGRGTLKTSAKFQGLKNGVDSGLRRICGDKLEPPCRMMNDEAPDMNGITPWPIIRTCDIRSGPHCLAWLCHRPDIERAFAHQYLIQTVRIFTGIVEIVNRIRRFFPPYYNQLPLHTIIKSHKI